MLTAAIAGTVLFSLPYSIWRSSRYFHVSWTEVAFKWLIPSLRLAACVIPLAGLLYWLARPLSDRWFMLAYWMSSGILALPLLFRLGLGEELRMDLLSRFPRRFAPILPFLGGTRPVLK